MKGITIKLPDETLRRLKEEAAATGRSVAAVIRERIAAPTERDGESVYALTSDLAGSVEGSKKPASNRRPKFRRS